MGSIFRIDKIQLKPDGIQHVKLTSVKYEDKEREPLKEHFINLVKDENTALSFGRLLYQMGEWEQSEAMYSIGLNKETKDYRKRAVQSNRLSLELEMLESDSAKKLTSHDQSLKKKQKEKKLPSYDQLLNEEENETNPNPKDLAIMHNNMATNFYKKKQRDLAMQDLHRAIEIYNEKPNGDVYFIATVYNNMACVLNSQRKHEKALEHSEKCLGIRNSLLPSNHPSLAIAYNTVAVTYNYLRQSLEDTDRSKANEYARKALEHAEKAVKINSQALRSDHPQLKTHMDNYAYLEKRVNNSN